MIAWIDAQAGVSGDMLLGAFVDAGVPLPVLQAAVAALNLDIELSAAACDRGAIKALKVDVHSRDTAHHRSLADIIELLTLVPEPVRTTAIDAFERLGKAEAAVHGVPIDDVHFHEVGAHDCLADIVGTAAAYHHLGAPAIHCSTVSLGRGTAHGAHGPIPVPGPAVLHLLAGAPVQAGDAPMESTTPTGAALLATLVTTWSDLPQMAIRNVGYGAGAANPAEVANILRLALGEPVTRLPGACLLETNVDDMDPRLWPHTLDRLLAAGAHDAWLTPILMKKGRPAHTLSVLCKTEQVAAIREVIYRETPTIGLREMSIGKHCLDRTERTVTVDGQPISVKTAWLDGEAVNQNPEWRDVVRAAESLDLPAKRVLERARRAAAETA